MYISEIYGGTGSGFLGLLDSVYGQLVTQTKGIEISNNSKNADVALELNSIIQNGNEILTSDFGSIEKGTAYDLVVEDYAEVVEMKKMNTISTDHNIAYNKVNKWYNRFIGMFLLLSIALLIMQTILRETFPPFVFIIGISMFLSGAAGMLIDKVRWKVKNK